MKKAIILVLLFYSTFCSTAQVQTAPYIIRQSDFFESQKGYKLLDPLWYGPNGIIQVSVKYLGAFSFQKFNSDLKLEKENTINTTTLFSKHDLIKKFVITKNNTIFFTRKIGDEKTEEVSAVKFSPENLDFIGKPTPLFQSSTKIKNPYNDFFIDPVTKFYDFVLSSDKTKFMYSYTLIPKEKKNKINHDIVGFHVFDEELNKLWGGEYTMPYTEAMMDNLGFTLSNNGKVYFLAQVYESDDDEKEDENANFHLEVLVYDKNGKNEKNIQVKLGGRLPKNVQLYEDPYQNIVITGCYSKKFSRSATDGIFISKLDVKTGIEIAGSFNDIPTDVLNSFSADLKRKENRGLINLDRHGLIHHLRIRDTFTMPDSSTKIIAEQYFQLCMKDQGCTFYADDIFIFSIDTSGKLEWVKRIFKNQVTNEDDNISINCLPNGNDIHLFFIDHIQNWNLSESQVPVTYMGKKNGFLNGVKIDKKGNITKYNLGTIDSYENRFYVRYFVKGDHRLIGAQTIKKQNVVLSITLK